MDDRLVVGTGLRGTDVFILIPTRINREVLVVNDTLRGHVKGDFTHGEDLVRLWNPPAFDKYWRRRKVPNPVAKNGATRPRYVSVQPNHWIVCKLGMIATSSGTIIVARKIMKSALRPGKRRKAKAYAASVAVISWPMVMTEDTTTLLSR